MPNAGKSSAQTSNDTSSDTKPSAAKSNVAKLTRAQLQVLAPMPIHRARNWSKAQVSVLEWPPQSGRRVVVKDLTPCALWFRWLAGRVQLRREWRALNALQVLEGVPSPVAWIDKDAFAMEMRDGRAMSDCAAGEVSGAALEKLEHLLNQVHARGVTHGDLHGDNILLDENDEPALIDWATACVFGKGLPGVKKWTFDEWRALDERALAKLKKRHAPHLLSEREYIILRDGASPAYRAVKRLRHQFYRLRTSRRRKK